MSKKLMEVLDFLIVNLIVSYTLLRCVVNFSWQFFQLGGSFYCQTGSCYMMGEYFNQGQFAWLNVARLYLAQCS